VRSSISRKIKRRCLGAVLPCELPRFAVSDGFVERIVFALRMRERSHDGEWSIRSCTICSFTGHFGRPQLVTPRPARLG